MENIDAILEGLNDEQKKAVGCVKGPVLIVAGAGSGKTRVLTSRIAYLIASGVQPGRILALTFTKKAAEEMKSRIAAMVGERNARFIAMGTFHSVFMRFLREYSEFLGYPRDFTVYDQNDSISLVKTILKELGIDEKTASAYKSKNIQGRLSMMKNSLILPNMYRNRQELLTEDLNAKRPKFIDIYDRYWVKCRQSGVMDFDDLLVNMNILLKDNPAALDDLAHRFDYIMVDEYQDTNYAQYLIIKKMSQFHRNICVVGDDSQSIYAFRGAKIENIFGFKKDWPDFKMFRLERNYRSTKVIVNAANSLISHNLNRIPKECYSMSDDGEKIRILDNFTEKEEAREIAEGIKRRIYSDKAEYQDFAILYRKNAQSRAIEEALRVRNIPYVVYSGHAFYDRAEVKDMMSYFKLTVNLRDDESFKRIVNVPARGIGDTSLAALSSCARDRHVSLFEAVGDPDLLNYGLKPAGREKLVKFCEMMQKFAAAYADTDAYALAVRIANESGYLPNLRADKSVEGEGRTANVEELLNGVKSYVDECHNSEFEEMQMDGGLEEGVELTDADFTVVTLNDYLVNIALAAAVDMEDDEDARNKVALMTMHSAKGLEFPYVFLAGIEESIIPGDMVDAGEREEERRLFYVALTRAKKHVSLSFARMRMTNGQTSASAPSRFIREIESKYFENPLPDGTSARGSFDDDDDEGWNPHRRFGPSGQRLFSGGKPLSVPSGKPSWSASGPSFSRQKPSVPSRPSTPAQRPSTPVQRPSVTPSAPVKRTAPVTSTRVPDADFVPSPVRDLKAGQRVEHNRFGLGRITRLWSEGTNLKAIIQFDEYGEKTLILQYAKLRIVEQ